MLPHRSHRKCPRDDENDGNNSTEIMVGTAGPSAMESNVGVVGVSEGHLLIKNIDKMGIHCHVYLL